MRSEKLNKYLGSRIAEEREKAGLNRSDLARAIDVSREYVNHLEDGRVSIRFTVLLQICSLFDITMDELIKPPIPEDIFPYQTRMDDYLCKRQEQTRMDDYLSKEQTSGEIKTYNDPDGKIVVDILNAQKQQPIDVKIGNKGTLLELLKQYQQGLEECDLPPEILPIGAVGETIVFLTTDIQADLKRSGITDKKKIKQLTKNYRRAGRKRKYSEEDRAKIMEYRREGLSLNRISERMGIPKASVVYLLRREELEDHSVLDG